MKFFLFVLTVLIASAGFAQRATVIKDTAVYNGKHYAVGDTVNLAYGSEGNKKFAYVQMGSAMLGLSALESKYSKNSVKIDKVYKQQGKCYVRGKMLEENIPGYKIFIDLEGAVDNKELAP